MKLAPIDRCFSPKKLFRGGEYLHVPCGTCPACLRAKQSHWSHRLDHEIRNSASTLFITLTYDNEHLPLVNLDVSDLVFDKNCQLDKVFYRINSVSHSKFTRKGKKYRKDITSSFLKKSPDFQDIFLNTSIKNIPHYVVSRSDNTINYDTSLSFAICLRKDVQDFVKRLRSLLLRDSSLNGRDVSFRYFICSEYGPQTFRPHYHGLLMFNDPYIASVCNSHYINKAWRKSSLSPSQLSQQSKFVSVGSGSALYTSKYVTKLDNLPYVLRNQFFKPFYVSSHSTPIGSSAIHPSSIGYKVRETSLTYTYTYQDKDTREFIAKQLPYPTSCWNKYFPRLVFSRLLPVSLLQKCYSRIFELPLYSYIPDYTSILERKYGLNQYYHTTDKQLHIIDKYGNYFHNPDVRTGSFYRFYVHNVETKCYKYGYNTSDELYKITYSDIMPHMFKEYQYDLDSFVDLYLFGIPQNRTVVRKIQKLREQNLDIVDSYGIYWHYLNLFLSKSHTNSLKNQYETYNSITSGSMSPQDICELYPTFYYQLPKKMSAFDEPTYEKIANILYHGFTMLPEYFYDEYGKLIDYTDSIRSQRHYNDYYMDTLFSHKSFETKRNHYYNKYGSGESLTLSAPT